MSDKKELTDYYGDYYGSIITGNPNRSFSINDISTTKLKLYINAGLSSVQIAKIMNISYTSVLRAVKKRLPEFRDMLRLNGKQRQIRKPNVKN